MRKIKIICTLGPKSINSRFLKFSNYNVDLLRLNMSHLTINQLIKSIKFIKTCATVVIIVEPPGEPKTTNKPPSISCANSSLDSSPYWSIRRHSHPLHRNYETFT